MKWKEYYILIEKRGIVLQLKNNWNRWATEEWHLISLFRKWHNGAYDYYFCIVGFQFRLYNRNEKK